MKFFNIPTLACTLSVFFMTATAHACDGGVIAVVVCDQNGNMYGDACQFDKVADLHPELQLQIAACPESMGHMGGMVM